MDFESVFKEVKYVIPIVMRKYRIYKNFEHFEQIGAIGIWKAYEKFKGDWSDFPRYAYTYVRNEIMNELRKEIHYDRRNQLVESEELIEGKLQKETEDLAKLKVEKVFATLQEEERRLLTVLYLEGRSYVEAAQLFGVKANTLKKRRDRVIEKIRRQHNLK